MKFRAIFLGMVLTATGGVYGQGSDAILDLLIQKGVINQREANEVREQLDRDAATTVQMYTKTKASSWLDALTFSGDFRLRMEDFVFEDSLNRPDRWRFRYRLRLGIEARFVDWAVVGLRLASGDGDPVSTNQSFTDTFRKKPVMIDAAYVILQPPGWEWIKVTGKMDIPIWQPKFNSPMVYDFDVTPEGVAEQLTFSFGDAHQHKWFANLGQFAVKELGADSNDVFLYDLEGGIEAKFGGDEKNPKAKVTAAGGYLLTQNLKNLKAGDSPNLGNALLGNSATTNNLADFNVVYGRGDIAWALCSRPFLGTPAALTFSGEYLKNLSGAFESGQTQGYTGQIQFGNAKKRHEWQVAYQYKYLEADATWDAITDSDWGHGGTDRKGHIVKAAYNLQDWWQLGFAAILTEKISSRPNTGHNTVGVKGEDLLRLQADSVFKF